MTEVEQRQQPDETETETAAGGVEQQSGVEAETNTAGDQAEPQAASEAVLAGESIEWGMCGSGLECGFVDMPADYRDPGAGTLQIAVNLRRARAPQQRIGHLLVNPGGPRGSGVEMAMGAADFFTAEVLEHFDVIGFDPRGVGFSEPAFACGEPGEQLALLAAIESPIDTPAEIAAGEAAANLCIESMGAVGGLLHSENEQVHQVLIEGNASRRVEDCLRANRRSQLRLAGRGREIIFTALIRCDVEALA